MKTSEYINKMVALDDKIAELENEKEKIRSFFYSKENLEDYKDWSDVFK